MVKNSDSLIYKELNKEDLVNWFDLKDKKFLHQVDTFYYSVKLDHDFTKDSNEIEVLRFRKYFMKLNEKVKSSWDEAVPFECPELAEINMYMLIQNIHFEKYYNICLECPDLFHIFIASQVPGNENTESVTPEMIVQIRSELLWQYGPILAFEYSYKAVTAICKYFGLKIREVKENRVDYCWHSNYIQTPERYFNIERMRKMQVSRFGDVNYRYELKHNDEVDNDYISFGQRGDKCFLRIYLKSKEVVEMGYKGWFFKEWLFNGLINRYDFYVYEKMYLKKRWRYMDKARLEWYLEYGSNENYKKDIRAILDGVTTPAPETISKLANLLTPKVTLITNIEFQTMRKMSRNFILKPFKDNECKEERKRIYDYFDNHCLITEYLTHDTFRLVDRKTDNNKSRCDYCAFWKALRNTKLIDAKKTPEEIKLQRDYTRKLNSEVIRERVMSAAVSYSLYTRGINELDGMTDAADVLCTLNDNDIHNMLRMKRKRIKQLNPELFQDKAMEPRETTFAIINTETGEFI